ncbi:MAG: Putative phosphatase YieH [uncultured Solirubrobacteraceae bacterium]|uniref:Phosphatase YieH n=1 Tax=uncultured Solirubrobacteraceae bacterium TaxID=1162706 RepID=A0A6J4SC52_9ACTN|nr:MAG: Putative phosphatase YieH [uncultured Solirubrobacteraceae bacterium]
MSAPFDLVILDCDGVLVDSEPISNRVLAEHLTAIGMPTTAEESMDRYMGGSLKAVLVDVQRRLGRAAPEDFVARYRADSYRAFESELQAVEGIEAALDALDGTPTCVASSGEHDKLRRTLGQTGLLPRFEGRIFSATEVARGKPAPDLFLHAAASMGADPARCAVVEDAPVGVQAALAAGMTVFAYAGRTPKARLARDGVRVFGAMAELPGLLTGATH